MGAATILIVFLGCVFASVPIGFSIGLSVVAYALSTGSILPPGCSHRAIRSP